MRILTLALLIATIASLAVSLASRDQPREGGWTIYTPVSNDLSDRAAEGTFEFDEYASMPWNDARLWLGLAIGFGISTAAVGGTTLRRRRRVGT